MYPKHAEWDVCVLESGACKKKFTPQIEIHAEVIIAVKPPDGEEQFVWKQDLRLDYVTAGVPNCFDADKIFQGLDSAPMQ